MIDILLIVAIGGVCYINGKIAGEENYKKVKRDLDCTETAYKQAKYERAYYRDEYDELVGEYNLLLGDYNRLKAKPPTVNTKHDLVQKALRKAMMDAHPDRSGTQATAAEFIAYKQLWDESRG